LFRLLNFESRRRISRYNQISVTIRPKAAYHSMYLGALAWAPRSMKSKSSTRFRAATMTITTLIPIPRGLAPEIDGNSRTPKNPMIILTT